jgi:hypothetical protein
MRRVLTPREACRIIWSEGGYIQIKLLFGGPHTEKVNRVRTKVTGFDGTGLPTMNMFQKLRVSERPLHEAEILKLTSQQARFPVKIDGVFIRHGKFHK